MTPSDQALVARFQNINVRELNDRRPPHKALLLLWAIGRFVNDEDRLVSFEIAQRPLNELIRGFGTPGGRGNADLPFWHLRNDDGLWEIDRPDCVRMNSAQHARVSDLKDRNIHGGIPQDVLDRLNSSPELAWKVVRVLLDGYFPPSLHQDVLKATRLDTLAGPDALLVRELRYLKRDSRFREDVLRAYENQCAVCGFAVRVDSYPVGLEAAHIRWHSARGPAKLQNGLALCVLHHKLFDRGVFTLLMDLHVLVDPSASGQRLQESLGQFDGSKLSIVPDSCEEKPAKKYLEWHRQTVFRSPQRVHQL